MANPCKAHAIWCAFLPAIFAGCASAPRYYLRLDPLESRIERDSAARTPAGTIPESQAQAGFLGERQGALEVSVKITNRSGESLEVDPLTFSETTRWMDTAGQQNRTSVHILDRNSVIQGVNFRKAKVESAENPYQETGADKFGGFLDGVTGLASAFSGGPKTEEDKKFEKERRERQEEREENRRKSASFENERIAATSSLGAEAGYLSQNLWGPTTLKPSESSEKSLLLNSHLDGDTLELVLPLGPIRHHLLFKQTKIRLN
jgi:hypothetical protein